MSYYRGDYYRGDYYRGDPGLFSFLGKAVRSVAKIGANFLPGPVGMVARGVLGAGGSGGGGVMPSMLPAAAGLPTTAPQATAQGITTGSRPRTKRRRARRPGARRPVRRLSPYAASRRARLRRAGNRV